MKKIKQLVIIFLSIVLFSCENTTIDKVKVEKEIDKNIKKIEVIDFYGTHRCTTCINIEANTKYTLDVAFKEEIEKGIIEFKLVNFDDEKNEKIVLEYLAYGTSLFLNVIKDGKEEHIDITEFAFKWGNEKIEYSMMLEEKIKAELAKL